MSNKHPYQFDLIVGDNICGDGHNIHERFSIACSHDHHELKEAYKAGVKIIGFDLKEQTDDCDANKLTAKQIAWIEKTGFDVSDLDPRFSIHADDYVNIWMFIAQLGNQEISYEMAPRTNYLHIGGYGLFQ